ncbi:hypothetical protein AciX8_3171 [Granulicella mallensis MP5ACTX8]|uniref:Uncharacterized protein n=1 Tax=Granulicella mallensis (strain ATCC BAA-1857 / DSM 23137 / MP5ACTX8) TaxID=682795 RepID=G8NT42_GRAMM|nr:hypothetical protein AciX8_3171 [Granulicella mallensis MP5ACTX8]
MKLFVPRVLATPERIQGNSKVVQIWDQNLEAGPQYFIMKCYADGELDALFNYAYWTHPGE